MLLARHGQSGHDLGSLEDDVLAGWAGAVVALCNLPSNEGAAELVDLLLGRLRTLDQADLPGLIARMLHAHLSSGSSPFQLPRLDCAYSSAAGAAITQHVTDVVSAIMASPVDTLSSSKDTGLAATPPDDVVNESVPQSPVVLLQTLDLAIGYLARNDDAPGIKIGLDLIQAIARTDGATPLFLAVARTTATSLLRARATLWPSVLGALRPVSTILRGLFQDLAAERRSSSLLAHLSDTELADLWEQLVEFWPHEEDNFITGVYSVTPDERARYWRNEVLDALATRGSADATRLLTQLSSKHPSLSWLKDRVRLAEERERQEQWAPLSPVQLTCYYR